MAVLDRAELLLQAKNYVAGPVLDLPGASGDYASAPDIVDYDITGDMTLIIRIAESDYAQAVQRYYISKFLAPGNQRGYAFGLNGSNQPEVRWSNDGTANNTVAASNGIVSITGVANDQPIWLKVDIDVGTDTTFWYSLENLEDPADVFWTLYEVVTSGTPTAFFANTATMDVGGINAGTSSLGVAKIFRAQVLEDIGGTLRYDARISVVAIGAASFEEEVNEATVTLNGNASITSSDWLDETGNGHNAEFGSTAGDDTNDPLFLSFDGTQHLYLPAVIDNNATIPDPTWMNDVADLDVRAKVQAPDYTPAASRAILAHWADGAPEFGFAIYIEANGDLSIDISDDGTAVEVISSSVALSSVVKNGRTCWVRIEYDGGAGTVDFSYSLEDTITDPDNVTWTALGTQQTATSATINDATSVMEIGSIAEGFTPWDGKLFRVNVTVASTVELDADFTDTTALTEPFATFTEGSSNAATVTINRTATGRKATVVDRPQMLFGTDDFFEILDDAGLNFDLTEDFTIMVMARTEDVTPASTGILAGKKASISISDGYILYLQTDGGLFAFIGDGTKQTFDKKDIAISDGTMFVAAGVRNTTDDDIEAFADGSGSGSPTTDASTSSLTNTEVFQIGRVTGGTPSFYEGSIMAVVLFREALSDGDVARAGNELRFGIFRGRPRKQLTTVRM